MLRAISFLCLAATVYATPVPLDTTTLASTLEEVSTLPDGFVPAYCHKRYTDVITDTTGWGAQALVQAPVKCFENEALSQFKLVANVTKNTFRYEYTCCAVGSYGGRVGISQTFERSTSFDSEGAGSDLRYLERHDINCGPLLSSNDSNHYTITGFQVEARDAMIRYKYQCAHLFKPLVCKDKETKWDVESEDIQFLDRHDVACPANEYIGRFQYVKDRSTGVGFTQFKIKYTCCA